LIARRDRAILWLSGGAPGVPPEFFASKAMTRC
jgi:hypothetical protein